MAYSLKIEQRSAVKRVLWFLKRLDLYNAGEALKDVEPETVEFASLQNYLIRRKYPKIVSGELLSN